MTDRNLKAFTTYCVAQALTFSMMIPISMLICAFWAYDNAEAQEFRDVYLNQRTVHVAPGTNATATALCNKGDSLVTGGYFLNLTSTKESALDILIHSNHPVYLKNNTSDFMPWSIEGWEAGLVNNGNEAKIVITASALCKENRFYFPIPI